MNLRFFILLLLIVSSCTKTQSNKEKEAEQQHPPVKCMENSPERRGEEGFIPPYRFIIKNIIYET
jgi:hypothetical protein